LIGLGEDQLGEVANVAARFEAQAPSGGICLSDEVHTRMQGKLPLAFHSYGTWHPNTIDRKMRACHVAHANAALCSSGILAHGEY
jgi:class 3 adenylate cyclase